MSLLQFPGGVNLSLKKDTCSVSEFATWSSLIGIRKAYEIFLLNKYQNHHESAAGQAVGKIHDINLR